MRGYTRGFIWGAQVVVLAASPVVGVASEAGAQAAIESQAPAAGTEEISLADEVRSVWAGEAKSQVDRLRAYRAVMERRGLAFAGFLHVFVERSYLDVFHWHKSRIAAAMAEMDSDADVSGLLALAKEKLATDALLSADAMMLAAMLNWTMAQPVIIELAEPNVAKDALVRPIHIHTLCLIAAAKQSEGMIEKLRTILGLTDHEEIREDILCAISAIDHEQAADWVKAYVKSNIKGDFNEAMRTALMILSKRLNPEAYQTYMTGLIGANEDASRAALLTRYRDEMSVVGVYESPPNGATWLYKGWDGFHFENREAGVHVRYGDRFEYFVEE